MTTSFAATAKKLDIATRTVQPIGAAFVTRLNQVISPFIAGN
jgi:hypothetical protein